ncbi:hypothetical protein RHMOL_Rhmol08G0298900 [Rhododendron molle]|uniref:Uncharacterized protein n=1 Tax=Rhododendron molle TaxID=49168 RepID=A0ACC0MU85_RHOML|nr:hypothetical protein RHMOL_Rhmol08G0298900 [Rhododendron molle]
MEGAEDAVRNAQVVDARARNISHNVRCTECGSQSIEDSQADVAILLRKLIRDEIRAGKSDKDIYKKLEDDFGETVLYAPKFDLQTAALWLSPLLVAGAAGGIWAYNKHRQNTNVHIMALNLVRVFKFTVVENIYSNFRTTLFTVSLQSKRTQLSFSEANIVISIAYQMGGNQVTEEVDTPKPGKPVGSMALTLYEDKNLSVGEPWSTGLFDCHENQTNAIVTACLPCITFGQISEIVDAGEMTCPLGTFIYMCMMPPLCSQWIMGSKYRAKLRKKYGLVEAPYEDVVSHIFCPCCSLCQEFRELKNRGLDPALALDHRTFMEVVKAVARQGSASCERVAIRADQKSYTYAQLISSALKISRLLCSANVKTVDGTKDKDRLGGARIGIVAKPSVEFVAGMLGTWFSGGVAVPLALSYPEVELLHVMNDSDVSMILSTEDHSELMKNVAAKSAAQFSLIPPVPCITEHDNSESAESDVGEDPALIIYTSGTTGKPKGVVHTHQGILAQVDFIPKFSVRGIWQRWRESYPKDGKKAEDAITVFTGVPTMYTRLIQGYEAMDPELQQASASAASKLRLMMCGSSALPYPVMQQWETITGHRLLERYGMTEFVMAISNPLNGIRKGGTVGKPLPGVQAKILPEDESGDDTTGVGELCIKSPSLFKEYWKLPEVTKESFIDGGFFKTGDAVKVDDDGYYVILGRTSADIMKVGGYKLSALEIESVLLEHPAVSECCVLGLPDKTYGEAVSAIIVPEAELKKNRAEELKPAIGLEELCTWAKERLAPYKLPTRLFLWDTLPRNAMGKVNKKELKKNLAAEG